MAQQTLNPNFEKLQEVQIQSIKLKFKHTLQWLNCHELKLGILNSDMHQANTCIGKWTGVKFLAIQEFRKITMKEDFEGLISQLK